MSDRRAEGAQEPTGVLEDARSGSSARETAVEVDQDELRIGSTWGKRFVLRRVLGKGGSATVFAAEHVFLKRLVALKVPHAESALSDVGVARIRREMQALAAIRHPGVVGIVDGGEFDGVPFIAMDLLEGRTLSGLLAARSRLEPIEVARLGADLAETVSAVHLGGIIHRDIKPSNVLVTADRQHQARLLDFGTSKFVTVNERPEEKLTRDGSVLGTPEYMAPESLLNPTDVDARADVYSLGVTLYECLTGSVPVDGPIGKIILQLSTAEVPSVQDIRSDVPPALARAIHRSIRVRREERYQSMAEFASDLSACIPPGHGSIDILRSGAARVAEVMREQRPTLPEPVASRRRHVRAPYITPARMIDANGASIDGRLEDISEGGALLIVATSPVTAGVRIRFALPISGRILEAQARSQWNRSSRGTRAMGFEFVALPDAAALEIRQYVALMGQPE